MEVWQKGYLPWELILLGKWVVADWDNIKGNKRVSPNIVNNLINKVKSFIERQNPLLKKGEEGLTKFMRRTAFQQFWHQKKLSASCAGRAIKLLVESNFSTYFEEKLASEIGITRLEIIEIALMIWSGFLENNNIVFLRKDYFSSVKDTLGEEKIVLFLKYFSVDAQDISKYREILFPTKNYYTEIFDKSPFSSKPFVVSVEGNLHLWSIAMLNEIIEFGIYNILKGFDSSKFGTEFGPIFESYIRSQLSDFNLPFTDEKELRNQGFRKQVDFVLDGYSGLVLIETKAVEASRLSQINPLDEIMANSYKDSIIKALYQAHVVFTQYTEIGKKKNPFLLVVSYKELYLGNGESVWDEFISKTLSEVYDLNEFAIPIENIFFISADGFDKLLICARGKIDCIVEVLEKIVEKKRDVKKKRFVFSQYLNGLGTEELNEKTESNLSRKFYEFHQNALDKYFPSWRKMDS